MATLPRSAGCGRYVATATDPYLVKKPTMVLMRRNLRAAQGFVKHQRLPAFVAIVMSVVTACVGGQTNESAPSQAVSSDSSPPSASAAPSWLVELSGRVAFQRSGFIWTTNGDGSESHQLFDRPAEWPHWSPDGTEVSIFCCGDGMAAHFVDVRTGEFREVAPPDPELEVHCGPWSADGQMVACESYGVTDPRRNGVYAIRSSDGGGLTRITSNPEGIDTPGSYAPDGSSLVFTRQDADGANAALFVVRLDGTGLRRITPRGLARSLCFCVSWSPDGTSILFDSARDGALWTVRPDGSHLQRLFLDEQGRTATWPTWSPDGNSVMFALGGGSSPPGSTDGLYVIDTDQDVPTLVLAEANVGELDWGE